MSASLKQGKKLRKISTVFRLRLLKTTIIIFLVAFFIVIVSLTFFVRRANESMLKKQINRITDGISYNIDSVMRIRAEIIAEDINTADQITVSSLKEATKNLSTAVVDVVDSNGKVVCSSEKKCIGLNILGNENTSVFGKLLNKEKDYVKTDFFKDKLLGDDLYSYAGIPLENGDFVVVGVSFESYYQSLVMFVTDSTKFTLVGESGFCIVCDNKGKILSAPHNSNYKTTEDFGVASLSEVEPDKVFTATINGEEYYMMCVISEEIYFFSAVPTSESFSRWYIILSIISVLVLLLLVVMFFRVNDLSRKLIVDNIRKVNDGLAEITAGNLDTVIDVRGNIEFSQLSDDINSTVDTLKEYIAREAARLDRELKFASSIQLSALPNEFPAFPDRTDIDIFASMTTAKMVGGDFYDFFFIDENKLAFIMADVSDKGIPAALFMMKAKAVVKSLAQSRREVNEVMNIANSILCEGNNEDMFVTLWLGILNTDTGEIDFSNAGHCHPIIRKSDGDCSYAVCKPNLSLGAMEGMQYRKHELKLDKGDAVFLYTDGVTEAQNTAEELYGEDRLLKAVSRGNFKNSEEMCTAVKKDVLKFTGSAPQSDDLTVLAIYYKG